MRDLFTRLWCAVVGSRCHFCQHWIFVWEARYWIEDVNDWLHGECACIFLQREARRLLHKCAHSEGA